MANKFNFKYNEYVELLKAVASLSRLYSDNDRPYIDSRFVEKLFVYASQAKDLSRKDNSFDALIESSKAGVGVKTFGVTNSNSVKSEKVAEFTTFASRGTFQGLNQEQIAFKAAQIRNDRIKTDASEYGINMSNSYYHCLLRVPNGAIIHEEPYSLIEIDNIKPVDPNTFREVRNFPTGIGFPCFTDGKNHYSYNTSKNVLFKRFEISKNLNSEVIPLVIYEDIFDRILKWFDEPQTGKTAQKIQELITPLEEVAGRDYVVLPLYSTRNRKIKEVKSKSGINQWNAGGRERSFGEAYFPVPKAIHDKYSNFFPDRQTTFNLTLPNGTVAPAKICQDNGKALMTDPNDLLCALLYKVIDPDYSEQAWQKRFRDKIPYTYDDLLRVGKDSVKVKKTDDSNFSFEFANIGSYERFINGTEDLVDQEDA